MEVQDFLRDTWQTTFIFVCLFIFTRFLGKTQIGQLTFYEYISGITIGSIAGNIVAAEPDKFWSHFYDLCIFIVLTYFISYITLKNRSLRNLIEGEATVVVANGKILKENMKKIRYDLEELMSQLRQQGVLDISEVQFAIFEITGDLSVIKKVENQPVSKADLGIQPPESSFPIELIMDGELIRQHLKRGRISENWLQGELAARGIDDMRDVLYAVVDSKGNLFVNRKQDRDQPQ